MNLKKISTLCFAASTLFVASSAMAWESADGQHATSANVGLFSDYVFRGISFSDEDPAIQGGLDYAHSSGFYLGTWASNYAGTTADDNIEIDIYGGFASEIGDTGVGYDLTVLRYMYPGQSSDSEADYNEYLASVSYSYFTAMIGFTPELSGNSDVDEYYYNLAFDYALPYDFGFTAAVGYTDSERNDGTLGASDTYMDYSIALSKSLIGLDFALAYTGTNSDGEDFAFGGGEEDDRLVMSVGASF
jgi:uncharacterized protein (TIGR02001 family)